MRPLDTSYVNWVLTVELAVVRCRLPQSDMSPGSGAVLDIEQPAGQNENGGVLNAAVLSDRGSRKALSALFTT